MTDDVLQLSRLRSHKIALLETRFFPYVTLDIAFQIYARQAEVKVHIIINLPSHRHYTYYRF